MRLSEPGEVEWLDWNLDARESTSSALRAPSPIQEKGVIGRRVTSWP